MFPRHRSCCGRDEEKRVASSRCQGNVLASKKGIRLVFEAGEPLPTLMLDRNKIEHGVDESGRKFYKIYYDQES